MKTRKYFYSKMTFLLITLLITNLACERELSDDYTIATFPTTADIFIDAPVGMGTDFYFPFIGEDETIVLRRNVSVSTGWNKYIIPIPDPSKLLQEKGMLRYSTGSIDGFGFTFWIDELKFEKLGTLTNKSPFIQGGEDREGVAFSGQKLDISDLGVTVTIENGSEVSVNASPNYFEFTSSNPSVASVSSTEVTLDQAGQSTITATLAGVTAAGSLSVTSIDLAPTPTLDAANVISVFSDVYTNSPVDYFNGYWAPWQTTEGQDDINVNGNNIIKYTALNFVGIEFQGDKTIDASSMTHFHVDIYLENPLKSGDFLTLKLQDLGNDNVFGGFDPAGEVRLTTSTTPALANGGWISVDLPFSRFPSLVSRANLAQIVFVSDATVQSIFVDNIYFHN